MPTTALTPDHRIVVSYSATGARHAMTTTARDTTGLAVCGSDKTLPGIAGRDVIGVEIVDAATVLNDCHLEGLKVCLPCRVSLSVAALAILDRK